MGHYTPFNNDHWRIGNITIERLICYRWVDISTCVQLVIE